MPAIPQERADLQPVAPVPSGDCGGVLRQDRLSAGRVKEVQQMASDRILRKGKAKFLCRGRRVNDATRPVGLEYKIGRAIRHKPI